MVVVAIVSVLATLGVYGTRRYIASSKTGEAVQMIGAIKAAQETYKDETYTYLDVSESFGASKYYPNNPKPGQSKTVWGGTDDLSKRWASLGVNPSGPVLFVYACVAGGAGDTVISPTESADITVGNWPSAATGSPWYVVKAKADLDAGGAQTVYVAPSFTTQIFSANEGE
jgi:type II secretory pathway pseudopilin PulG